MKDTNEKMTNDKLREILAEMYDEDELDEIVMFENPSYANAVIGISEDRRLIYDMDMMVECLMEEDGMEEIEAIEFIEYNTVRSLPYVPNHPIIKHNLVF